LIINIAMGRVGAKMRTCPNLLRTTTFIRMTLSATTFCRMTHFSGLYYKLMTIVNDDSRVVNKLEASLIDDARVVIYDRHMFIVQATQ
jgi:hypothetical protein